MIYTAENGSQHMIELDTEIIIGMRLNNFNWNECIDRHNTYLNRSVPTTHITSAQRFRSSEEWIKAIEEYWQKYYGYPLQPHTQAAQRLGYHIEANHPVVETFGIEVEFFTETDRSEIRDSLENYGISARTGDYRDWNRENWIVKTDGSISPPNHYNGCEIASPILTHNIVDQEIKRACHVLNQVDAKVNRTCGLHVHMGEHNFTGKRRSKIAYQFIRNEYAIDKLMPHSRRGNQNSFCEGWGSNLDSFHTRLKDKTSRTEIREIVNPHGRYKKLNMQTPYTTIESRQHSGTTNHKKIIYWKDFVVGMCDYAIKEPFSELKEPDRVEDLINNVSKQLPEDKQKGFQTFFNQRYELFQGIEGEDNEYETDNEEIPY